MTVPSTQRVAVVTGASSGIGLETAKALVPTGEVSEAAGLIVTASGTVTKGAATLIVHYIIADRANEAQP